MLKLEIIGRIGKDAIVNNVSGKSVINFNVAHSEKYTDASGEKKEKTTWVDCAYWTDRTAVAPYLLKGGQVFVEGTPEVRSYAKNDGTTSVSLVLRVNKVELLGGKQESNQDPHAATIVSEPKRTAQVVTSEPDPFQDLPF